MVVLLCSILVVLSPRIFRVLFCILEEIDFRFRYDGRTDDGVL